MGATTISIRTDTYRRLKGMVHQGQSFDGIINEMLDELGEYRLKHHTTTLRPVMTPDPHRDTP